MERGICHLHIQCRDAQVDTEQYLWNASAIQVTMWYSPTQVIATPKKTPSLKTCKQGSPIATSEKRVGLLHAADALIKDQGSN